MRTGELGIQIFIKSAKAFQNLKKTAVEEVPEKYRGYFVKRDKNARGTYRALSSNQGSRAGRQTIYDFI